jgi:hypothetical protein
MYCCRVIRLVVFVLSLPLSLTLSLKCVVAFLSLFHYYITTFHLNPTASHSHSLILHTPAHTPPPSPQITTLRFDFDMSTMDFKKIHDPWEFPVKLELDAFLGECRCCFCCCCVVLGWGGVLCCCVVGVCSSSHLHTSPHSPTHHHPSHHTSSHLIIIPLHTTPLIPHRISSHLITSYLITPHLITPHHTSSHRITTHHHHHTTPHHHPPTATIHHHHPPHHYHHTTHHSRGLSRRLQKGLQQLHPPLRAGA